jgi:AraC family transcriptional regulator of adaptative response/methylated-DNA-[protein]-cysteine methyltransferase
MALAAFMDKNLCWLDIAPTHLSERDVFEAFAAWRIEQDEVRVQAQLDEAFGALAERRSLDLCISASPFQIQVWQALTRIAPGETLTYGQLAASIGKPGAARAVGSAAAANSIALFIPCHRLIPATTSAAAPVGSYRWGDELKQQLLETERHSLMPAGSICANRAA